MGRNFHIDIAVKWHFVLTLLLLKFFHTVRNPDRRGLSNWSLLPGFYFALVKKSYCLFSILHGVQDEENGLSNHIIML